MASASSNEMSVEEEEDEWLTPDDDIPVEESLKLEVASLAGLQHEREYTEDKDWTPSSGDVEDIVVSKMPVYTIPLGLIKKREKKSHPSSPSSDKNFNHIKIKLWSEGLSLPISETDYHFISEFISIFGMDISSLPTIIVNKPVVPLYANMYEKMRNKKNIQLLTCKLIKRNGIEPSPINLVNGYYISGETYDIYYDFVSDDMIINPNSSFREVFGRLKANEKVIIKFTVKYPSNGHMFIAIYDNDTRSYTIMDTGKTSDEHFNVISNCLNFYKSECNTMREYEEFKQNLCSYITNTLIYAFSGKKQNIPCTYEWRDIEKGFNLQQDDNQYSKGFCIMWSFLFIAWIVIYNRNGSELYDILYELRDTAVNLADVIMIWYNIFFFQDISVLRSGALVPKFKSRNRDNKIITIFIRNKSIDLVIEGNETFEDIKKFLEKQFGFPKHSFEIVDKNNRKQIGKIKI